LPIRHGVVVRAGRPYRRAVTVLVTAALLTVAGCSFLGTPALPSEPFSDFVVGEFGGIDGRQNILYVRPDGVALLVSHAPAAGRLSDQKLSRLQTVLTSEQFQQEVVREARRKSTAPEPVCSDQITTEVTMGSLSMSRTEPCGDESQSTPAFDEIVSIVAPALRGNFDGPVDTAEPRLLPLRLERIERPDQRGYTIKVEAAGPAMITETGGRSRKRDLTMQQRDTLRLLLARVIEKPVSPCTSPARYQLDVESGVSGPDCGFPQRQPEFHALAALLENVFNV
jgi:hypothetical protein